MTEHNKTLDPELVKHMRDVARHLAELGVSTRQARDVLREYVVIQDEVSERAANASATAN